MNTEYDAPFHVDDFGSKNFENRAKKFWAILDGKSTFITVCPMGLIGQSNVIMGCGVSKDIIHHPEPKYEYM